MILANDPKLNEKSAVSFKENEKDSDEIMKLIKLALKGDNEAFGRLVTEYEKFIYNIIYQITGNKDDAFDVSQEVFIKAYRALKNFRGDCKFSTWLYKIAINTSKDYLRDRSKRYAVSLSDWTEDDGGDEASVAVKPPDIAEDDIEAKPEEAFERLERKTAVREAIMSLSEDHRDIITLRDIEGFSYEDISEMLGLEIGTVKSRLNRARHAVKEYLIDRNFNY